MNYDEDTNNEYGDESSDESTEAIMAKAKAFNDLEDSESLENFLGCQGCGQKYGEFNCKECKDRFCRRCFIREHRLGWSTRKDCTVHTLIVGFYSGGDF